MKRESDHLRHIRRGEPSLDAAKFVMEEGDWKVATCKDREMFFLCGNHPGWLMRVELWQSACRCGNEVPSDLRRRVQFIEEKS